ncbi:MAG: porin family protein [Pseudomonadota bacterium]
MKINMLIIAAAAASLPLQVAQAQSPSINAQLAATDIAGFNTGVALMVGYEHPIPALHENFSVEGELSTTIMNPESTYTNFFGSYKEEMSYYTAGVYAKYTHPINQDFSVFGRVGVHYENITHENSFNNSSVTQTAVGRNLGVGADYNFTPKMAVTVGATLIDTDVNIYSSDIKHISVGMKFKL